MKDATDEFYVGYHGKAPAGVGRFNRMRMVVVGVLTMTVGVVLAVMQGTFGNGQWDWENKTFSGFLEAGAVPTLAVMTDGDAETSTFYRYTLVAPTKFGVQEETKALHGTWVSLQGSVIERDGVRMIAIEPESLEAATEQAQPIEVATESLGAHTFQGEIVDSKCFLGAMNPGNLKPHKQCAILCIQGGVPPVLLVRDASGRATYLHLVGSQGEAVNAAVLEFVAEPIEVHGEIERRGNLVYLKADPGSYRRL